MNSTETPPRSSRSYLANDRREPIASYRKKVGHVVQPTVQHDSTSVHVYPAEAKLVVDAFGQRNSFARYHEVTDFGGVVLHDRDGDRVIIPGAG